MKTEEINKVLNLFVGDNEPKEWMNHPNEYQGNIYATNGAMIARISKDKTEKVYPALDKASLSSVFPKPSTHKIIALQKSDFEKFKTADELNQIGLDIDCAECRGHGIVEWEYKKWQEDFDCPACHGKGYFDAEEVLTGNKTFNADAEVWIGLNKFNMRMFYTLVEASEILNESIYLLNLDDYRASFKIGDFEILIMGLMGSRATEENIIKIKA